MNAVLNVTTLSETKGLSSGAHRLLIGLLTYRNRETGQCNPGIGKLHDRLGGVPRRTIFRWLAELRSKGILDVEKRPGASSFYVFNSCGNPRGGSAKNGSGGSATFGMGGSATSGTQNGPLPYMNQTVVEPTEICTAAVPVLESKTAAAAGGVAQCETANTLASPPALQMEFDLGPAPEPEGARPAAAHIDPPRVPPLSPPVEITEKRDSAEALVDDLMPVHPEPGDPGRAVAEAQKILLRTPEAEATIRRNHEAWQVYWAGLDRRRFIPQLWRWLHCGEWKYAPADRKGVVRETWQEQQRREGQEEQEKYYLELAQDGHWDILAEYTSDVEKWRAKVKTA